MPEPNIGPGAVAVRGLADLQRAFNLVSRDLGKGVREALQAAGDPVSSRAQQLAVQEISGLRKTKGIPAWSMMRVGLTRHSMYVAPEMRGVKSSARRRYKRGWDTGPPSFPELLLTKAMIPALEENQDRAVHQIGLELDELFRAWERV